MMGVGEGLSQEDSIKAEKFVEKNKASVDKLKGLPAVTEKEQELLRAEGKEFKKVYETAETTPVRVAAQEGFQKAREKFQEAFQNEVDEERQTKDAKDANLWRAEQHKNEHLDEYITTAAQEGTAHLQAKAEVEGTDLNSPDARINPAQAIPETEADKS